MNNKAIEIPFGAKDSELKGWEYTIPKGMEAEIKDGKVIVKEKESEDERIRKELVSLVKEGGCITSKKDIELALAYLEKQKDASKAIEAVERIDKYIDAHTANAHDMDDSNTDKKYYQGWDDALGEMARILQDVYSNEKQKEQKPVECIEFDNEFKSQVSHILASVLNKEWEYTKGFVEYTAQQLLGYAKHEIKPVEWSEEDELMRNACIAFIKDEKFKGYERSYECIDWLKSFPERFNLPSKQEWSEEDEENFKWFDKFFRAESILIDGKDIPQDKYLWFKSLRPQPKQEWNREDKNRHYYLCKILRETWDKVDRGSCIDDAITWFEELPKRISPPSWKPSEEQMNVFRSTMSRLLYAGSAGSCYKILESLYNDLKALKNE